MGGANRAMFQLIKELKYKYSVHCVCLLPDTPWDGVTLEEELNKINVPVVKGTIEWFYINSKSKRVLLGALKHHIKYLWKQRNFYKQLNKYNIDIVHSNSSVIDIGGYLSRQLNAKHVWHLREMADIHYGLHSVGCIPYKRFVYSKVDAFIAISKCVAKHFSSHIPQKKLHIIYDGVIESHLTVTSLHNNAICHFICAGNISNGKNQIEIVYAIAELKKRGVKKFHVTFVGHNEEPCTSLIRKEIGNKECTEFVTIMPEQDGISHLLPNMDVGIIASKHEAFGLTNIEFQLQNLLVIGNDSGATPELLNNGDTGLIYHLGDYQDLANKMQNAIENKDLMITMAEKGRKYAKEHFTSEKNTKNIYMLYNKLISKK